jgi:hypothetical protein
MNSRDAEKEAAVLCVDILSLINAEDPAERAAIALEDADDYRVMRDALLEEGAYDSAAASAVADYAANRVSRWPEALPPLLTCAGALTAAICQDNPDGAASAYLTIIRLLERIADLEGDGREP